MINEHVRIWKNSVPPNAFSEYVRDFWQRSVLFLDILRERGNQRQEMLAHGVSSVLMYDSELVMRGDELPHPVNYSLLRIIPPEGAEIDDRKRPVFVIDPRAGQGERRCLTGPACMARMPSAISAAGMAEAGSIA
jgi:hypothetical protein